MTSSVDIIMLALPRWDGSYSSTAYSLAKEFAKKNRVFYIDNPFTIKDFIFEFRSEQIKSRRNALIFERNVYREIAYNNLTIVTPPLTLPINFLPSGFVYETLLAFNDRILFRAVRRLLKDYKITNYIFINSFNPFYFRRTPDFFKPILNIYHTVDDISHSKYVSKHGLRLENDAIRKADLTFTTSYELKRLKIPLSDHIYYLPNAADVALFENGSNLENAPIPNEIASVTKPIIIYTGHIDYRLDYDLIKHIVAKNKDKFFLMIGPVSIEKSLFDELNLNENISFIGKKDITELPNYLRYAQCAIIPFKCNTLTKSIYPLKVNEYLAAGKPVVSTPFSDDILDFRSVIEISESFEGFSKGIGTSIDNDSQERVNMRLKVASRNTWEARIDSFWDVLAKFQSDRSKD